MYADEYLDKSNFIRYVFILKFKFPCSYFEYN